jgi:hypothetical protein
MRLTFNEQKKCWILNIDDSINGVRKRQAITLPFGWSRDQATAFADHYASSHGIQRRAFPQHGRTVGKVAKSRN